jgi:hypothetical protein
VEPVLDGLLKDQIRGDHQIAGMLAAYKGKPAFFYQKSPADTDRGWTKPCYPRADYNIDMRYDPERKTSGALTINVWCTSECEAMPEDIEKRFTELVGGTFYTDKERATVCAIWNRSDAFAFESAGAGLNNTAPEVFGVTMLFDLTEFPEQVTTDPDPILALNAWTRRNFPGMTIIAYDDTLPVWRPTDANPAVYWRFERAENDLRSYAVNWYNGHFAAHIIADTVKERNGWIKAITEAIMVEGEILLTDESPMFAKQVAIRHGADPLREGQMQLTGRYGVLAGHRRERARIPLWNPNYKQEV